MGKHKTKIEKIANAKNRHLAFYKRKKGLLKKAMELSIMCDVHIILCIFNTNNKKCAEFTTMPLQEMIDMYNNVPRKDVSVFAPHLELDQNGKTKKIQPMEWNKNSQDKLMKSAEIIRKSKQDISKKSGNKRKRLDSDNESEAKNNDKISHSDQGIESKDKKLTKKSTIEGSSKRRKVSESDEDSDYDCSMMDDDQDVSYYSDNKSAISENKINKLFEHITKPMDHQKILFSPSPVANDFQKFSENPLVQNIAIIDKNQASQQQNMMTSSPDFKIQGSINTPVTIKNLGGSHMEEKMHSNLDFKSMVSPDMICKQDDANPLHNSKGSKMDQTEKIINFNQSSKTEGNQSFTFDNQNPMSSSMKSPGSIINFPLAKNISNNYSIEKQFEQIKQTSTSPNLLFYSAAQNTSKIGNIENNRIMNIGQQNAQNLQVNPMHTEDINKFIDELSDLPDEGLAATKAAIQGKASELAKDDSEKKKKRVLKLKNKGKNLKVSIPTENKFLENVSAPAKATENRSPMHKIFTPTPTKPMLQAGDFIGNDPGSLFLQQLSNKGGNLSKGNLESPFLLNQDSK